MGPEGAALEWLRADALVSRCAAVGVDLQRRPSFDADRDAALALAVDDLRQQAAAALGAGDFPAAVDRLNRARAFRPTASEARALDALALDTFGRWAAADLDGGRFRAALAHADAGLAVAETDALLDLRAAVLDAGSVWVAVLPAESDDAPTAFLRDLDDVVSEDRLAAPPAFVEVVDPAEVRRWARGRRSGPALADSPRRIGQAAADLGADLGVVAAVGPVTDDESLGAPRPVSAEVRGGGAATYVRRRVTLTASAQARVVGVEPGSSRPVCDDTASASFEVEYDRASYDGDWRDLALSPAPSATGSTATSTTGPTPARSTASATGWRGPSPSGSRPAPAGGCRDAGAGPRPARARPRRPPAASGPSQRF